MARPQDNESAEANMIRDELRAAVKQLDTSLANVAIVIDRADRFLRPRAGSHAVMVQTPAVSAAPVSIRE